MRFARPTSLFGLLTVLVATVPLNCSTKAVGVDVCQDIENARCEQGVYCKTLFAVDDVNACKRFYRDQCLHGLNVSEAPGKPEVTQCVDLIKRLGACAKKTGEDTLVTKCSGAVSNNSTVRTVCELMKNPEYADECSFIVDTSAGGSGGESGAAGSAGTSGKAGSGGDGGSS